MKSSVNSLVVIVVSDEVVVFADEDAVDDEDGPTHSAFP